MRVFLYGKLHDEKKYFIIFEDTTIIKFDRINDIRELMLELPKVINGLEKIENEERNKKRWFI